MKERERKVGDPMYTVLLSGGSGKRLWPLSNELRSKQYIKLLKREGSNDTCSMIQRVWGQLAESGLQENAVVTASAGQVEIIRSQLGDVHIVVEPDRRDTFPAIALSCVYIKEILGAAGDACVCILPVDPYVEKPYFEQLKKLGMILRDTDVDIALMGTVPDAPSTKFGYIIPCATDKKRVERFIEKPTEDAAEQLVEEGALWNCGVFCFRLQYMLNLLEQYQIPLSYRAYFANYDKLPKTSFDYEVVEKSRSLAVEPFNGKWKDLGTWDALAGEMASDTVGKAIVGSTCQNTKVINELDQPVMAVGTKNIVIAASLDGILVSDIEQSGTIKNYVHMLDLPPMYEERRWGTLKILEISENSNGNFTMFRKILMFSEHTSSYHYHLHRDETITVLDGRGVINIEGVKITLSQGTTITIPRGKRHAIKANSDLEYMEIHIGETIGDDDINRLTFDWDEIDSI